MRLYSITDKYINYLRKFDNRVYDNKEDKWKVMRKYLGIVLKINQLNYYITMSSPKKSDYKNNEIRKSIVPIIRIVSPEEIDDIPVLKGTLRISNMIPVPDSELILYEPKNEKNKNYKILVEKELEFIDKNENIIKKYANILYKQKVNNYNVSYIKSVVDFKLLEEKCIEYIKMNINSRKFYENTKNMGASPNLKKFIKFNVKPGKAIDIGCGAGRDTAFLIKNNWEVVAIDKEDVLEYIDKKITKEEIKRLKFIKGEFENVLLEKNKLVVANNSIIFCSKKHFKNVWNNIVNSIEENGYFIGTFLGEKDSWKESRDKMKFFKKSEVLELFNEFQIIEFQEIEMDKETAIGEFKHWHIYAVIAKKVSEG